MIAKKLVDVSSTSLTDKNQASVKSKEEYKSQFKKFEKPFDTVADLQKKEKEKTKFIDETNKDQIQVISYVT